MPSRSTLTLACLGLVLALAGCATMPEARPTRVVFTNSSAAPIFVSCNVNSFDLEQGSLIWRSSPGWDHSVCEDCHSICNPEYFADPGVCYLEIPPQGRYTVEWDGRLYDERPAGCSCGRCYQPLRLTDGQYTFVLLFDRQLPADGSFYPTAQADGTTRHFGRMGIAQPAQRKGFAADFSGQAQLDFVYTE
jgi:hypothetical protein